MKTLFITLVAATMLFSACNHSTNGTTAGNTGGAPILKFEKETHDFGKIHTGQTISYDFKFTNTGSSPLIITDGYATCGCTKPTWPTAPIKPGESGKIHVTFDSKAKMGLQDKLITIVANTTPAQNMVHLIGEVVLN